MSGLHIYCIVPPGHAPAAGTRGLDDRAVALLDAGPVALWYSEHPHRTAVDTGALRRHNSVIAAAATDTITPVPVRFGQWFDDAGAAVARTAAAADHWLTLLDAFAGRAEYGVRFVLPDVTDAAWDVHRERSVTGAEYMADLMQRHALGRKRRERASALAAAIAQRVAGVAADTRVELDAPGDCVSVSCLVAHRDRDAYHERLDDFRRERPQLSLLCTGPWPPYSFAG